MSSGSEPVTAVIVGAGNRGLVYASYAQDHPDELKIVGVADPRRLRRKHVAELYDLSPDQCFETAEEMAARPQMADAAINGTMDHLHIETTKPLLRRGYDVLLEKPFATDEEQMWDLLDTSTETGRLVVVCHVLRYTAFYRAIRERIARGEIGDIINIQTTEHVSYHHTAVAYVRGKWSHTDGERASMLLAKCSHDLDVIAWLKSGTPPRQVASFGSNMQFQPERAPEGAGERCLVDCEIEEECLYSARKHYIDHPNRWAFYVWEDLEHLDRPTIEDKVESLKGDNPYGRCVWKCDTNVVDHQSVAIEFEDGTTATHNMIGGSARPSRGIHVIGTQGEIRGTFEDSRFVVDCIDPSPGREYAEEVVELDVSGDMHGAFGSHGGGDMRLVQDFVRVVRGKETSISTSALHDSITGHMIGFAADRSMREGRIIDLRDESDRFPKEIHEDVAEAADSARRG